MINPWNQRSHTTAQHPEPSIADQPQCANLRSLHPGSVSAISTHHIERHMMIHGCSNSVELAGRFLGGVCVVDLKLHPAACLFPEDVGNGGWCAAVPGIGVSAAFVAAAHKIYLELACYAVWVLTCNLQHRLGESPFYTCLAYGPFAGIDRLLDPAWNSLQK
ncbi:hypothetical protein Nepgr_016353 [Nepenthes gracilis]|uniref:Uncharacterized protein n=1 Tax=Nepenthes gracilis TaxID=150966 RepID=A0AAD3SP17_NEPGR|nr:hypothetical protein Nepgr_016353 [Nepenthes gracilis]